MKGPAIVIISFFIIFILFLVGNKFYMRKEHGVITRKGVFRAFDKILIVLSVLVIVISILWDFNFLKYRAPIEHKDWEQIEWQDFRGLKRPSHTLDGDQEFAFISSSIKYKKRKEFIEVTAFFHPCRSYVYNRNLFAEKFLKHELYHFHVTEYHARLFRKEIIKLRNDKFEINLDSLYRVISTLENEFQYEYDDSTYHGYIYGKQLAWQEKIDSCLLSLEDFSKTLINLME